LKTQWPCKGQRVFFVTQKSFQSFPTDFPCSARCIYLNIIECVSVTTQNFDGKKLFVKAPLVCGPL
jgi:hypothetical protein